tara:strand:- start:4 stop:459 length:456 start_codon:yes stop_codon:yes gene_type:complete
MTETIDIAAQSKFVHEDNGYKLVLERHQKMWDEVHEQERQILVEGRKVARVVRLMDICIEKFCECADVAEGSNEDKTLKQYTGENAESWFHEFEQSKNLLQELLLDQCSKVLTAKYKAKKVTEEAKLHCDQLSAARTEAEKRYKESLEKND